MYKDVNCVYGCKEVDSYEHSLNCVENPVIRPAAGGGYQEIGRYIRESHFDRVRVANIPLI